MVDGQPTRVKRPTLHLVADVLGPFGGIESYLDALARRLLAEGWPVRVAVSLNAPAPFLEDLEALGLEVYRQRIIPGDRWQLRQRLLIRNVARRIRPGDWVYCVRAPMPEISLTFVRAIHRRGGKFAASWALAPEFFKPPPGRVAMDFNTAVREMDAVVSVSNCTCHQFKEIYGYEGRVHVVRYHNQAIFPEPLPLPAGPPYQIGFLGRIDIRHKNLDTILAAFQRFSERRNGVRLNLHGGGPDFERVRQLIAAGNMQDRVVLHGPYDHRKSLREIVGRNHLFIYTSRFEGGPCFSLLELLQAGRYVVTSPVGGIPDIYQGRPEAGDLVPQNDSLAIADGLERAVHQIERGAISQSRIRAIYDAHFHDDVAHQQLMSALSL